MFLVFIPIIGCILLGPLIAYVTRRPLLQPGMSHIIPPTPSASGAGVGPHAVTVHPNHNHNQTTTSHHGTPVGSTPVNVNANDVNLEAGLPAGTSGTSGTPLPGTSVHGGGCCVHGGNVGQRFGLDGEVEFCQEPVAYGTM
jgi:hypothetical protein